MNINTLILILAIIIFGSFLLRVLGKATKNYLVHNHIFVSDKPCSRRACL